MEVVFLSDPSFLPWAGCDSVSHRNSSRFLLISKTPSFWIQAFLQQWNCLFFPTSTKLSCSKTLSRTYLLHITPVCAASAFSVRGVTLGICHDFHSQSEFPVLKAHLDYAILCPILYATIGKSEIHKNASWWLYPFLCLSRYLCRSRLVH